MDKALDPKRHRFRRNLTTALVVAAAALVAAVGIAPFVFLIWMVRTVARWLGDEHATLAIKWLSGKGPANWQCAGPFFVGFALSAAAPAPPRCRVPPAGCRSSSFR
ncbi:hypothetical protein EIQ31_24065 [Agrobacterium deltaense]|nr:hypothetical protein EIQ31_24065 [Agrobacterium deltaense]